MPLQNTWVKYVDRTYQQIKDSVLSALGFKVPEITDHTESNIYVKQLDIWAGIAEMLGYYIDNGAREPFITETREYPNAIRIARMLNYRVKSSVPAAGAVKFTLGAAAPSAFTIPKDTILSTAAGIKYVTIEDVQFAIGDTFKMGEAVQIIKKSGISLGLSDGTPWLTLPVANNVREGSLTVVIDAEAWDIQERLNFSGPADKHYLMNVNENKYTIVQFGNGVQGQIPAAGKEIFVDYEETLGEAGKTDANTITVIDTALVLPVGVNVTVTNPGSTTGGTGVESLERLRRSIPMSLMTMDRAVTRPDFIAIAEMAAGVARAGFDYACGKQANIYIIPEGGGIAGGALIASVQSWMNVRTIVGIEPVVASAGEVTTKIIIDLEVIGSYQKSTVSTAVKNAVSDFMSYKYQEIDGRFRIGDLYEVIESVVGVKSSIVTGIIPYPFPRPLLAAPTLTWTRELLPGSTVTKKWYIQMVTASTFQVIRANGYMGIYSTGVLVSFPEIKFTVTGAYTAGDSWEFITYPYNANQIDLQEPSIPVSAPSDVTVNASGGL